MDIYSIIAVMLKRTLEVRLKYLVSNNPAVLLLGPRQIGKTTLARALSSSLQAVYYDLESPSDRAKLADPELALLPHAETLVILDEIQHVPNLFPVLRSLIDRDLGNGPRRNGRFLLLGSASLDLLRQSSESLAGRIAHLELGPLSIHEVAPTDWQTLWVRGGFPNSFLAHDHSASMEWRHNFIRTYLERDIPQLGIRIPAETLRRFITMLTHHQSGILNAASLARNLAVDGKTVAHYIDLLTDLLLVRRLPAWHGNIGKRLTRSPKLYVRDSGLVHALLGIATYDELLAHPVLGASWEGFVLEQLLSHVPIGTQSSYYRTATDAEIDLVLERGNDITAIEVKHTLSPKLSRGFKTAFADVRATRGFVVYPGTVRFPLAEYVDAIPLADLIPIIRG